MAFKISNEIRTAILGILAIVLFLFGFNYLKGSGLMSSSKTLYAIYDDAKGLTPSSFVQVQGVTVGSVKAIKLSKKYPGKVEVEFNINKDIAIPVDSKAMIVSSDLLGNKAMSLILGTSGQKAETGAMLTTQVEVGMMDKFAKTGERIDPLVANVDGTITDAKTAIHTIDATVANFNGLVNDQTKRSVQQSVAGLQTSVKDFNALSAELAAQRAKIGSTVSSLEAFAKNLNANGQAITATMNNVRATTDKLAAADITAVVGNLKNTLAELDATIAKVNNNTGTAGMLINDKKLYNDLAGSLHSLDALLADMKANPSRYVSFSLISRKPKSAATESAPNN
jgi:phospholipid/cholesterol/gamma-HCH transport system substrate-binding protein